jgi:hypothetical protein
LAFSLAVGLRDVFFGAGGGETRVVVIFLSDHTPGQRRAIWGVTRIAGHPPSPKPDQGATDFNLVGFTTWQAAGQISGVSFSITLHQHLSKRDRYGEKNIVNC